MRIKIDQVANMRLLWRDGWENSVITPFVRIVKNAQLM
jgi:hypothetical protein